MCTLILGFGVVAPGTLLLAANRDEDPARPTAAPALLHADPRVTGGRDLRAGGTWLAVRERRAVVALLNRRDPRTATGAPPAGARSRGALTLEVAAAPETGEGPGPPPAVLADLPGGDGEIALARSAARRTWSAVSAAEHGPFTLVWASPSACWAWRWVPGEGHRLRALATGWHVVTHAEVDDPGEPRTAWLRERLAAFRPDSPARALAEVARLLAAHGAPGGPPAVCIHEGRMVTVSSSAVWLAPGEARYWHAEGPACTARPEDLSSLLAGPAG